MKFSEFEEIMTSRGYNSLAEIARTLNTSPQAVSNWKSRGQIPNHIVLIIKTGQLSDWSKKNLLETNEIPSFDFRNDSISLSDIMLVLAKQLKLIIIIPTIFAFATFTYTQFIYKGYYQSSSKILLPKSSSQSSGINNLANQFGLSLQQGPTSNDLTSPSLFPELVNSFTFAERIFKERFYVEEHKKELPLLSILTKNFEEDNSLDSDSLINSAMSTFQQMISFESDGSFSLFTVKASEPKLARDINNKIIEALISLNKDFKSQNVIERIRFINSRIEFVDQDLKLKEKNLKNFRERNRQTSSPSLRLEEERLSREVDIQKGIFITLKQQLELANIEKIQNETIIRVLDKPQIPLYLSGKNTFKNLILSIIIGLGLGIFIAFFRSYLNKSDLDHRIKINKMKANFRDKSKEIFLDFRITGLLSAIMGLNLPFYLNYESKNPAFFGMYSSKLMVLISLYILTLSLLSILFVYSFFVKRKKYDKKNFNN